MSSPPETEEADDDDEEQLPPDFSRCVEKLLSSVSTLSKHLSVVIKQTSNTESHEEITNKLQVRSSICKREESLRLMMKIKEHAGFLPIYHP